MSDNIIYGTDGNDILSGGNGKDTVYGGDGDDIISGGNGVDTLFGDGGNDQLYGDNGSDHLTGGAGDDLLDGKNGFDTAYYSGTIGEYSFLAAAGYLHILHLGGAGPDGHDRLIRVERLVFADRVIDIGSGHNAPVAGDDHVFVNEDTGTHNSGAASVLNNDFDFDGDALTVTGGTFTGTYGTLTLNANGTYSYTLFVSAQELAQGENVQDSFNYTVSDNDGSDTGTLVFHIAGVNDGPVANPDTDMTSENAAILIDVLANDTDVDNNAVLTVIAASAPAGRGTASVVGNQVEFDPGADFDDLAVGDSEIVVISYSIEDEHGATDSSTITVTVTGTNDAPTANPETDTTSENATILIDVLANDTDVDNGAVLTVAAASAQAGQGTASVVGNQVEFDPGTDFDDLAVGESEVVAIGYDIVDEHGAAASSTITITVTGVNDAPTANPDADTTGENATLLVDVLANDTDAENGAALTVTAGPAPAGQGTVSVVGNQVEFDPGTDFDDLAVGESEVVVIGYDIEDEQGATDSSTVTIMVTGTNDGPVANPETDTTSENVTILINVLANDSDADSGATLTVSAASAPAGQGTASVVGNQVEFDPGTDFDDLAVGESEVVVVSYDVEDEHGATASSTVTITVTGANDGPVANADVDTTSENSIANIDVLANDTDADNGAVLVITAASAPVGQGTATIVEDHVQFDPGSDFDHLANGESAVVVVSYTIRDEHGASSSSTVTITVQGRDEGITGIGTEGADTITGTSGDDTINALGGDDTVVGLAGDDLINGGNGDDYLSGDDDNDIIEGGNDNDFLAGGEGHDQLFGQAGNDGLVGDSGDDQLSGGDGFDTLSGEADDDVLEGGNDDDLLFGGEGNDQLFGEAGTDNLVGENGDDQLWGGDGNDGLDGGAGDDTLVGGEGDDFLGGGAGSDVLTGGLGDDYIIAGSFDGPQTIDGGDGNDTIRHYYRSSASTIATGSGSDTIELAHANLGAAAITVTDFTAGAGGDMFRLSGDDGALLSLLSGWDGSSNPFGSGFLRLQQSGADTLLEWDQDGAAGGSDWQTLVVFQSTDAGDFTDANFVPGYHPDGSAPAGQTITGTAESETLTGTIGDDTIDALGGNDTVFGGAGGDLLRGGDGNDSLNGEADDDVLEGGNDDDLLFGGEGNDQLFGEAGTDNLVGENGDDQLWGGDGNDGLDGGAGDDTLVGGEGDDFLGGGAGSDVLTGGLGDDYIIAGSFDGPQTIDGGDGNDTIRHYYRSSASTIATGSGSDTIELAHANLGAAAITVTDFTAGAGGDMFRLSGDDGALLSLLSGWDGSSNPFGSGFLRLQQSGADTLLEWDQDGAAGGSDWQTLVVFQSTDAGDFTDANFVPGYHPDGSAPAGQTITGTAESETLTGTIGDDTIDALGGNDTVFGGAGGDLLRGGDGNDSLNGEADDDVLEGGNDDDLLFGGEGNDQLFGEAGTDNLVGENGDDQLWGGDGNDGLDGGAGDDTLVGGEGDDFLGGGAGSDVLTGGLGDDYIIAGSFDGPQTIDGGDGNDTIRHYYRSSASTIATGSGSDTIELAHANLGAAAITVTDFTAGAGGDMFRLSGDDGALLSLLSGWDGSSNPFGSGFLRLQQSGADTLLEWDQDGAAGGSDWQTLVVFQSTDAGDFTDANFVPGYHPDGSAPAGQTITGTAESETLTGTIGDDTIDALGGNDTVFGGAGGDLLRGGDGYDLLNGGAGGDLLRGGDGNDSLNGEADDDVLEGGNDDDLLFGGEGNDQLFGEAGTDNLVGENGDDQLWGGDGNDGLDGGDGDDTLVGGEGDDFLWGGAGSDVVTGGLGDDALYFQSDLHGPDEITDFVSGIDKIYVSTSGFGGDLIAGGAVSLVSGTDPAASDATSQFLFDTDDGRLLWDADGTGSGGAVLIATLSNIPSLVISDFAMV